MRRFDRFSLPDFFMGETDRSDLSSLPTRNYVTDFSFPQGKLALAVPKTCVMPGIFRSGSLLTFFSVLSNETENVDYEPCGNNQNLFAAPPRQIDQYIPVPNVLNHQQRSPPRISSLHGKKKTFDLTRGSVLGSAFKRMLSRLLRQRLGTSKTVSERRRPRLAAFNYFLSSCILVGNQLPLSLV